MERTEASSRSYIAAEAMRLCVLTAVLLVSIAASAIDAPSRIAYWDLPTGSRIAYIHFKAASAAKQTPLVFLHGGPGAYLVDHPAIADGFYRDLAKLGFDVYIYDQIGSGHSARLADPRQYSVDRHVRDLEAIRQQIGAPQFILIGDSWGATLAANYMALHPEHCAKAIFSGPGLLEPGKIRSTTYDDAPMTKSAEAFFSHLYGNPRYRRLRKLIQSDPMAANRIAPDQEMDAQLDAFVQRSLPFLVCDPTHVPSDESIKGMGFWVNAMTAADMDRHPHSISAALLRNRTPVLILRGGCDYVRWDVAYSYKTTFPNSILLYVPDAGHAFGYDQPKIYSAAVKAFLLDQALPVAPFAGTSEPPRVTPKAAYGF
ncbi:MAG TPA: alpha/beta hydrolase [Terriglobales bacterium]|nr:alpha/beta hydrolase [Terriglobales bacterium]